MSFYKTVTKTGSIPLAKEHHNPPFSIPSVTLPHWEVHDNFISPELHREVHEYLKNSHWLQVWGGLDTEIQITKPNDWDDSWINAGFVRRGVLGQPRALYAFDEAGLVDRHPLLWTLWQQINAQLGGGYSITGAGETMGMFDDAINQKQQEINSPLFSMAPPPLDPSLGPGWRVYANATLHDLISPSGYAHRDNPDLSDETSVTILWIASEEWYPSWGSELMILPEDHTGASRDHQQFNNGGLQQRRNFNVGWPDDGKIISMRPGRLIVFDSRAMHITLSSRHRWNVFPNRRVCFRARKVK